MISILMPLYNGVEFLHSSLLSISNQVFSKWELIIGINGHDNVSSKEIIKIVRSFKDNRIKVTFTKKGKSQALNALVKLANFKYICMIDVDDIWLPNKLQQQLDLITKYDVVGTDVEYFGDKTGSPGLFLGKLSTPMFSWQNPIINSTVMMKKSDAQWDEAWEGLDDYNMWIELLKKNKTFYNIPNILARHRLHDKSYFNNKNGEMNQKLLDEKVAKLTEEELLHLTEIMDNKKWEL